MTVPIYLTMLEEENFKRIKAFRCEPKPTGLTILGGKNKQGKTSVIDGAAWLLGGAKFAPSNPQRDGAMNPPHLKATLSNGLVVERKGKNGTLTVTDPTGQRGTQGTLDAFISTFALDLPKFLNANAKEKANVLLKILGIGDKLVAFDLEEKKLYNERLAIGQIATSKEKHADEMPEYADAPAEPVSISELIQQQQAILAKNGQNQMLRSQVEQFRAKKVLVDARIAELLEKLQAAYQEQASIEESLATAEKSAESIQDESTLEIEASIANIETINQHVAANAAKSAARDEAENYRSQYNALDTKIEEVRAARMALLDSANLPLPGLTIVEGEIQFNGQPWDCMAESERLRVAVSIVRALQPDFDVVFMDKLEQMDLETLAEFNAYCDSVGLQVIGTRVSTGSECSIIIEDGLPQGETYADVVTGVSASAPAQTKEEIYEW